MRHYCHTITLLCLLVGNLLISATSLAQGKPAADISGTWKAEPVLAQLGYIQTTYIFNRDGSFRQKLDFQSFCGIGAVTPDCQHYWLINEGRYTVDGKVLHLHTEKGHAELLYQGQMVPEINDMGITPNSEDVPWRIEQGQLLITDKKGRIQVFKPVMLAP